MNIIRTSIFESNVRRFVNYELSLPGTQVLSSSADRGEHTLRIVAVGREISDSLRQEVESRLSDYGLAGYRLTLIQGVQSDSILAKSRQLEQTLSTSASEHQKILELASENASLSQRLAEYELYEEYARELRTELAVLFPSVHTLSLSPVVEVQSDTTRTERYVAVLIGLEKGKELPSVEEEKLHSWLKARIPADSLVLIPKVSARRQR